MSAVSVLYAHHESVEPARARARSAWGWVLDQFAQEGPRARRFGVKFIWRWIGAHGGLSILIFLWLLGLACTVPKFGFGAIWESDYLNYWFAPRAVRAGINPYDVAAYQHYGLSIFPKAYPPQFNFTYPPHSLFLFWPLSYLPAYVSWVTWSVLSLAFFWVAAKRALPPGLPSFLAVLTPATVFCLNFGQTSLIAGGLFLLAAGGSGVAAGLLTFKPQLGFLAAPLLLLKGRKPVWIAITTTIVLIILSQLIFGGWKDFVEHASGYQAGQIFDEEKKNIWYIIGTTPAMGYGRLGMVIYMLVATIVLVRNFNVWTAATATFLISPYGFHYDMSVVTIGFVILLHSYWNRMSLWQRLVASLVFLAPVIVQFGTWWIPPIVLLGLFIQTQHFPGVQLTWKNGRFALAQINQSEPGS